VFLAVAKDRFITPTNSKSGLWTCILKESNLMRFGNRPVSTLAYGKKTIVGIRSKTGDEW